MTYWDLEKDKSARTSERQQAKVAIEEPRPGPLPKYKNGPKPFVIERRYVGPHLIWIYEDSRQWHVYRRYKTEKSADEAMQSLMKKKRTRHRNWEYRRA